MNCNEIKALVDRRGYDLAGNPTPEWLAAKAVRDALDTLAEALAKAEEDGLVVRFPLGTFNSAVCEGTPREIVVRLALRCEISRTVNY